MIKITSSTQEEYDSIILNAVEKEIAGYPKMDITTNTACFSGWYGETLLAVAGFQEYWPGLLYSWIVVGNASLEHPIETVRAMNRMFKSVEVEFEVVRFQCTVRKDFKKAQQLVEHLGFEREGLMRKYCPDSADAYMYGKVIK
jgi:hypothetical protein